MGDKGQYKYAQLLTGKEKGKVVVAVRFLEDYADDTIAIKRKFQKGKQIQGMTIVNKGIVAELFGKDGSNDGMNRFSVQLIDSNMLKIID